MCSTPMYLGHLLHGEDRWFLRTIDWIVAWMIPSSGVAMRLLIALTVIAIVRLVAGRVSRIARWAAASVLLLAIGLELLGTPGWAAALVFGMGAAVIVCWEVVDATASLARRGWRCVARATAYVTVIVTVAESSMILWSLLQFTRLPTAMTVTAALLIGSVAQIDVIRSHWIARRSPSARGRQRRRSGSHRARASTAARSGAVNPRLRFAVLQRDSFTCVYCGRKGPQAGGDAELEVDHRIPVALGGASTLDNLVTACRPCNRGKGAT